jgi:hypothetical protein
MKEVVHIEHRVGPQGGRYWVLKLDCGHHTFRSIPATNIAAMLMPVVHMGSKESERAARARQRRQQRGAPHRAKCYVCEGRSG